MGSLTSQPVDLRAAPTTGSTSSLARRSLAASTLDSHRRSPIGRGDTSINRTVADLMDIPSTGEANMPRITRSRAVARLIAKWLNHRLAAA